MTKDDEEWVLSVATRICGCYGCNPDRDAFALPRDCVRDAIADGMREVIARTAADAKEAA